MTTATTTNPIASSAQYVKLFNEYKTNLLKYQPGPRWYFDSIELGIGFNEFISMSKMQEMRDSVSPIGDPVTIDMVNNVTPSYDWIVANFPKNGSFDYDKYQDWIVKQKDVFSYSRGREDFSVMEAFRIAASLGYRKVIMEDLS